MGVVPNMVVGTLKLELMQVYALIDSGANRSFIAYQIEMNYMYCQVN